MKRERIIVLIAALILGLIYVFPIWQIDLNAPQYPEGIGLNIWAYSVTGQKPNDLQNINGLNHYIGMKHIDPEAIPELKIIPPVIAALMLFGLFVAYKGNRKLLYGWLIAFGIFAVAGLIDFYLWEYNYGHNLNPNAPIKVPGMTYQPPLIGSKQLLNINAVSLPGIGGIAAFVSVLLGITAVFLSKNNKNKKKQMA